MYSNAVDNYYYLEFLFFHKIFFVFMYFFNHYAYQNMCQKAISSGSHKLVSNYKGRID